ncbi:hypothetical protein J2Z42_001258 [Clostridium algifaecis]|uniref:Fur family transcriptional regulator n=1 Tax=Clostridium algifaecis TaxID=1472040 RepID=A0ABS4KT76_9CLOT|nr:hypothetical protein [Clostridium algifaecis]MBP2032586.1 hypothetical protein [Clostridium algifaecis]
MLLNLSEKLQKLLKNCKVFLNGDQIESLAEILEFYNNGILPAKILKHKLEITYKDVHTLMTCLAIKGILRVKYRIYCENDSITGASKIYDDIEDIPVSVCDRCDKRCTLIKNVIVEFEVHI